MSEPAGGVRRAGLSMAAGTLVSRLTGLVRTAVIAAALGVTTVADAYNIANTVPTILLVLVTGGTLSAVLIPMLVATTGPARQAMAGALGSLVLWATLAAAVLAALSSPLLARLFALGLRGEPEYDDFVRFATAFLVLFAPQVVAYGVSVHAVAVMNACGRLALGAFASVLTNVVTIAAVGGYVLLRPEGAGVPTGRGLLVLGAGTTLGVVAMAAAQSWGAHRLVPGMRVLSRPRRDETTRRVLSLGRWTVLYVVMNQVGLAVVLTVAAGFRGASAYQWAFAVMQLPFAIVAVSVLSALFPRLSRAARDDQAGFAAQVSGGLRLLLTLLIPAAVLLAVLARPLTELLLGYGAVDRAGVELIATGVRTFSLALLPFTAFQLLTRACYARADARTPALVNVAVNLVNIIGAGLAVAVSDDRPQRALIALVLAYAASYAVGCMLLGARLVAQCPGALSGLAGATLRLSVATAAMLAGTAVLQAATEDRWPPGQPFGALLQIVVTGGLGGLLYTLIAWPLLPSLIRRPRRLRAPLIGGGP